MNNGPQFPYGTPNAPAPVYPVVEPTVQPVPPQNYFIQPPVYAGQQPMNAAPQTAGYSAQQVTGYSEQPPQPAAYAPVYPVQQPVYTAQGAPVQPAQYLPPQPVPVPVQPVYAAAPSAYVPANYYVPSYAIGGVREPRNPRQSAASKMLNRMCLLMLAQTAAGFVWQILFIALFSLAGLSIYDDNVAYQWLSVVNVPLTTALPFVIYLFATRTELSSCLKFEKVGFFSSTLCVLGGLAVCLLANYPAFVVKDFLENFGYDSSYTQSFSGDTLPAIALEFFAVAILAPLLEEFVFRGIILSHLKKYGVGFAIVASSLIFGMAHLDVANVLFAFVAGLTFGFIYAKTNNLWLTIFIHALNNALAVLMSHTDFFFGEAAYVADNALMFVPIAIGVIALFILLIFKRDIFISYLSPRYDGPSQPLSARESAAGIVRAPAFWIVAGFMVLYTFFLLIMV